MTTEVFLTPKDKAMQNICKGKVAKTFFNL